MKLEKLKLIDYEICPPPKFKKKSIHIRRIIVES